MLKRAVVLLSGGLDSATTLAQAIQQGFTCFTLSVDYGQRHRIELQSAAQIADTLGSVEHKVVRLDLTTFGGSALTDDSIEVPTARSNGIPSTYVPARNTIMLSLALAWAEVIGSRDIFIGANAVDYSGYPDCRPEYIEAFATLANLATKAGVEGAHLRIHAPLINLGKAEIIQLGVDAGVDFSRTVSCYQPNEVGAACRKCDSCRIRRKGFEDAGIVDPTIYLEADPIHRES